MKNLSTTEKASKLVNAINGGYFGSFASAIKCGALYEITIDEYSKTATVAELAKDFDSLTAEQKTEIISNY